MINYSNIDRKMGSKPIQKNGERLKNHTSRVNLYLLFFIVLLNSAMLSAQIKTIDEREKKEPEKKEEVPDWWEAKDEIFAPYDSSYYIVKSYPTLDAYNKYVGQQLYCPKDCDQDFIEKYFKIIDVLSVESIKYQKYIMGGYDKPGFSEYKFGYRTFRYQLKECDIPCFVLQEIQSGDTIYAGRPQDFIIVGGFVKAQQKYVGETILKLKYSKTYGVHDIYQSWICTDVVLDGKEITLILEDVENSLKEDGVRLYYINDYNVDGSKMRQAGSAYYCTATTYNIELEKALAEVAAKEKAKQEAELKRQQEDAAYRQQVAQAAAKRKQDLINKYGATTAEKILKGEFEIGMSKEVCKEIAGYAAVVDKTVTTETWKITHFFGGSTYLKFVGDKLVRIVNP